jgi:outer membrane protein OmpA-like peptidoglycan-associated protein
MRNIAIFLLGLLTNISYAEDCQQANQLAQQGQQNPSTALTNYEQALTLCTGQSGLYYGYGLALMQAEQYQAADNAFKQALALLNQQSQAADFAVKRFSILLRQSENQLAQYNKDQTYNRGAVILSLSSLHAHAKAYQLTIPEAFTRLQQAFQDNINSEPLSGTELKLAMRSARDLAVEAPLAIEYRIPFDFNSDKPSVEGMKLLQKIGDSLNNMNLNKILIIGHTDSKGDANYNLKLSDRRAKSVKNLLVKQQPQLKNNLEAKGVGENEPRYSTSLPEQDALNRRVEFILNP